MSQDTLPLCIKPEQPETIDEEAVAPESIKPPTTNGKVDAQHGFSFTDGRWRPLSRMKLNNLRITPNEVWVDIDKHVAVLITKKSYKYEEYALSEAGLEYLETLMRDGKLTAAYVVSARLDGLKFIVVHQRPLAAVINALDNMSPRDGFYGPYYWMNSDLSPYIDVNSPYYKGHNQRPLADDDFPF